MAGKDKQKGIYFKVSEEERNLIEQKMALAGVHNMSAFIRKMSIDGYVVDLENVNRLMGYDTQEKEAEAT